jgi:hypothetical protein
MLLTCQNVCQDLAVEAVRGFVEGLLGGDCKGGGVQWERPVSREEQKVWRAHFQMWGGVGGGWRGMEG